MRFPASKRKTFQLVFTFNRSEHIHTFYGLLRLVRVFTGIGSLSLSLFLAFLVVLKQISSSHGCGKSWWIATLGGGRLRSSTRELKLNKLDRDQLKKVSAEEKVFSKFRRFQRGSGALLETERKTFPLTFIELSFSTHIKIMHSCFDGVPSCHGRKKENFTFISFTFKDSRRFFFQLYRTFLSYALYSVCFTPLHSAANSRTTQFQPAASRAAIREVDGKQVSFIFENSSRERAQFELENVPTFLHVFTFFSTIYVPSRSRSLQCRSTHWSQVHAGATEADSRGLSWHADAAHLAASGELYRDTVLHRFHLFIFIVPRKNFFHFILQIKKSRKRTNVSSKSCWIRHDPTLKSSQESCSKLNRLCWWGLQYILAVKEKKDWWKCEKVQNSVWKSRDDSIPWWWMNREQVDFCCSVSS